MEAPGIHEKTARFGKLAREEILRVDSPRLQQQIQSPSVLVPDCHLATSMLAHLKHRDKEGASSEPSSSCCGVEEPTTMTPEEEKATKATCDVLCSLSASCPPGATADVICTMEEGDMFTCTEKQRKSKTCPKQHQLPMFLSKTYHMIDCCDGTIATWSAAGDNFVVKNVEKFASHVLPLYFKHSNFSSFARQLNFYGFRKLRTDPILTSDVDPRTACFVRFYHEKFQKDRPELLHQIKRATKSDQQSKDDVESLKLEVSKLKDCIGRMSTEMDRKLAEMSYEYNRRITNLNAEYDKLAALVTQILARQPEGLPEGAIPRTSVPDLMHSLSQVAAMSLQSQLRATPPTATPASTLGAAVSASTSSSTLGAVAASALGTTVAGAKRCLPEESEPAAPCSVRPCTERRD